MSIDANQQKSSLHGLVAVLLAALADLRQPRHCRRPVGEGFGLGASPCGVERTPDTLQMYCTEQVKAQVSAVIPSLALVYPELAKWLAHSVSIYSFTHEFLTSILPVGTAFQRGGGG